MLKRIIAGLSLFFLLLGQFPVPAAAGDEMDVRAAIGIAKAKFYVPDTLDKFQSNYEDSGNYNVWSLDWKNADSSQEISVRVNAKSGEIEGYSKYDSDEYNKKYPALPKYSFEQGVQLAEKFIKDNSPAKVGQFRLQTKKTPFSRGTVNYDFTFVRQVNNIDYSDNYINVTVNAFTGQINNMYCNWQYGITSSINAVVSPEKAQELMLKYGLIQLQYQRMHAEKDNSGVTANLYYIMNRQGQFAVDAVTGELVEQAIYRYDTEKSIRDMGAGAANNLLPWEEKEADAVSQMISQEDAVSKAVDFAGLDSGYKLDNAQMYWDYEFPELMVWSLSWIKKSGEKIFYASAEVDSRTGQVLAFDKGYDNDSTGKYAVTSSTRAEQIAVDFFRDNYPDIYRNMQKSDFDPILYKMPVIEDQPSYYFNYERVYQGVVFPQNSVNIRVNSYTGEVDSFRMRYLDGQKFASTSGIVAQIQFADKLFAEYAPELNYISDENAGLRLVYAMPSMESSLFDARTGVMVDYNGTPVQKETEAPEISGISGHYAEEALHLLNSYGMLRVENGQYAPDQPITQAEAVKMIAKFSDSYMDDSSSGNWYDDYYRMMRNNRWIKDAEVNPSGNVSRQLMAALLLRSVISDDIANLDIYKFDSVRDEKSIAREYRSYLAAAYGMGLMTTVQGKLMPEKEMTRGQAAVMVSRFMNRSVE